MGRIGHFVSARIIVKLRYLLSILLFWVCCTPVNVNNPGIPYSKAWWETNLLRCVLGELEACVPGPRIIGSFSTAYVSGNSGAVTGSTLNWSSDSDGSYSVLAGSTSCSDGTSLYSGTITAFAANTSNISASSLSVGANYIRVCVTDSEDDTGSAIFRIDRDDTAPSVTTSPSEGAYNSAQSVSLTCTDDAVGCDKIAFVTDTSTPDIDGPTGTINVGTQYSTPINVSANTATDFKFQARDKAGNVSTVSSASIVVDTVAPSVYSTNPSNSATGISPSPGAITLNFGEPMDTGTTMSMTTEVNNGTGWVTIPNSGTVYDWQDSQTLVITVSWIYFPENSQIRWTIPNTALRDIAGNTMSQQGTFTTGSRTTSAGSQTYTGPTAHGTYTSDIVTSDSSTGLNWKTCWEGKTASDCSGGALLNYTWENALNACAYLNTLHGSGIGYYARQNWRLPNITELYSLKEGSSAPYINSTAFPNPIQYATWTSTPSVIHTPNDAWGQTVVFAYGTIGEYDKTFGYEVLCVSD